MSPSAHQSNTARRSRKHGHWLPPARWGLRVDSGGALEATRPGIVRWELRGPSNRPLVRAVNLLVAVVGLVIAAPLFIGIAILVKLSSPGPVFYVQERVGLNRRGRRGPRPIPARSRRKEDIGGRVFRIYKFRTMVADSDRAGQVWASVHDPRITAVGQVLRKYRLDELPQLINVLKGEMNVVGPRPEQPQIFQELRSRVPRYQDRQRVLPGITGWAQINHAYDQSIEDVQRKVALDLEYIERRSLWQDLRIMARTLPVMVGRKGAI
ncbi:MAG: sugar transferase [Longimicrobiales bacterium]|nr:sugar transferase [Longimicrobiales bacterium]